MRLICLGVLMLACGRAELMPLEELNAPRSPRTETKESAVRQWSIRGALVPERNGGRFDRGDYPTALDGTLTASNSNDQILAIAATARRYGALNHWLVGSLSGNRLELQRMRFDVCGNATVEIDPVVTTLGLPTNIVGSATVYEGDVVFTTKLRGTIVVERDREPVKVRLVSAVDEALPFEPLRLEATKSIPTEALTAFRISSDGNDLDAQIAPPREALASAFDVKIQRFWPEGKLVDLSATRGPAVIDTPKSALILRGTSGQWTGRLGATSAVSSVGEVRSMTGETVALARNGERLWRRFEVPPTARRISVSAQILSSQQSGPETLVSSLVLHLSTATKQILGQPSMVPLTACKADEFKFCSGWKTLTHDVEAQRGKAVYLSVGSQSASFVYPNSIAWLIDQVTFE